MWLLPNYIKLPNIALFCGVRTRTADLFSKNAQKDRSKLYVLGTKMAFKNTKIHLFHNSPQSKSPLKKSSENGEGFTLSLKICDLKTSNLAMLAASATQETGRWPPRKHSTKNIIVDNGHSILIQRTNPHGQVYDLIRTDRYLTIDINHLGLLLWKKSVATPLLDTKETYRGIPKKWEFCKTSLLQQPVAAQPNRWHHRKARTFLRPCKQFPMVCLVCVTSDGA